MQDWCCRGEGQRRRRRVRIAEGAEGRRVFRESFAVMGTMLLQAVFRVKPFLHIFALFIDIQAIPPAAQGERPPSQAFAATTDQTFTRIILARLVIILHGLV